MVEKSLSHHWPFHAIIRKINTISLNIHIFTSHRELLVGDDPYFILL
jgi:hypothetical protein